MSFYIEKAKNKNIQENWPLWVSIQTQELLVGLCRGTAYTLHYPYGHWN